MTARQSDRESGFTLVEVLVAFAIAAIASIMVIRISADIVSGGRRVEVAGLHLDEAEGIVLLRATAGTLRAGFEHGTFSDGQPWTLSVADVGPRLGWQNLPPVWRVRLTLGGSDGGLVYTTLVSGGLGGT